jgi:hypothetical protein
MAVRLTIPMLAALVASALAACGGQSWLPVFDARLAPLKGQPIETLIGKLGPPNEQTGAGDDSAYFWYGVDKAHPWRLAECTIRAGVDKNGRIAELLYFGNEAGCGRYARKLQDE